MGFCPFSDFSGWQVIDMDMATGMLQKIMPLRTMLRKFRQHVAIAPDAVTGPRSLWGRMPHLIVLVLAGVGLSAGAGQNLELQLSSEMAPAGGSIQLKILASSPALVASGRLAIDFDRAVFGDVTGVAVYSAVGDAIGFATVVDGHFDAQFSAESGGMGQLPGVPILTVRLPILKSVVLGTTIMLNADASKSSWTDPFQNKYSVSVNPGRVTVGGELYVKEVTPGGGLLAAGAHVRISGDGFQPSTQVSVDGAYVVAVNVLSSQEIDLTFAGPIELTGRRIRLSNPDGTAVDFFPAFPSVLGSPNVGSTTVHLVPPLRAIRSFNVASGVFLQTTLLALLNQNEEPVQIGFLSTGLGPPLAPPPVTIPGRTLKVLYLDSITTNMGTLSILASRPIRMLSYFVSDRLMFHREGVIGAFAEASPPPLIPDLFPQPVYFRWQQGTPLPEPATQTLQTPITVSVAVTQGHEWLRVTQAFSGSRVTVTINAEPAGLKPGAYQGVVTITPIVPPWLAEVKALTSTIPVSLTVSPSPFLRLTYLSGSNDFTIVAGGAAPIMLSVTSTAEPLTFSTRSSTTSGGNWLRVSPSVAVTPATLTITADTSGLIPGTSYAGAVTIQGPSDTLNIPFGISIPSPTPVPLSSHPESLVFVLESGQGSVTGSSVLIAPQPNSISVSVETESGGNWLRATATPSNVPPSVRPSVSAEGLPPGEYRGVITVTSALNGSVKIPVKLTVTAPPSPESPPRVSPSAINLTARAGDKLPTATLTVGTSGTPFLFKIVSPIQLIIVETQVNASTDPILAPATFVLGPAPVFSPGVYHYSVLVTWTNGSAMVPVTLNLTAGGDTPPLLATVTNAASQTAGAISPGEIITIFGQGVGPGPSGASLDASARVTTSIGEAQVLINGRAAPLVYGSPNQVSAIVPYELGTSGAASVQVVSGGAKSDVWMLPVASAAPGIFTIDSRGVGQSAVLNQDNSVNSTANPATRGSVIQIFATGEGQTLPPGVTGSITHTDLKRPVERVTVSIGGLDAHVLFAGNAGEAVAGLLQVNAVVPSEVGAGPDVPIAITIGELRSPAGATIAVN